LPRHSHDGVHDGLVVAPLRRREAPVGLHSNHGDVGRVPDGGADGAGDEAGPDLAAERHGAGGGVGPLGLEDVVETHTGGGVERLAEDGGGDAGEEGSDAFLLNEADADRDGAHAGLRNGCHVDV